MDHNILLWGAIALAIFIGLTTLFGTVNAWFGNMLMGPEYCFSDVETVSLALQNFEAKVTITHSSGDLLCFRTQDKSLVEKINAQIQERKLQEELARIQANQEFWDRNFLPMILIAAVFIIILILLFLFVWS